jgi:hypothetical protein
MNGGLSARTASMQASRYLEILIRIRAIGGTAANVEVAALRRIAPPSSNADVGPGR